MNNTITDAAAKPMMACAVIISVAPRDPESHQRLPDAKHNNSSTEYARGAKALNELRTEHHESGNQHRVSHDTGGGGWWLAWTLKLFTMPAQRNGQRCDIERT